MCSVRLQRVKSKAEIRSFAALPRRLYGSFTDYVAPLDIIQCDMMNASKNPFFQHAEAAYWIAEKNGRKVGRISAQIDKLDATRDRPNLGHFGNLAAIDDAETVAALFDAVEQWLAERRMTTVTGPFNLSINGESGLMVSGHKERHMFLTPWDPPYLDARVKAAGYTKVRDLHSFEFTDMDKPIEMANRFAVMSAKMKIRTYLAPVSTINSKLDTVLKLFNDAWENNWGFVPMTREELAHMAKDLKPLLTDECLSIVEVDGVPAAFALALPNLTEVSADLDGQLLPLGWARLGWRVKRRAYTSGRLLLMGVSRQYRETGLGAGLALLAIEKMREGVIRLGIRTAELGWVLEDNRPLLRMLDLLNVRRYKTHRVYQKSLVETPASGCKVSS